MRSRLAALLVAAPMLLAAGPASADEETPAPAPAPPPVIDDLHLRNGSVYRGRVTEIVPGDHVTIVLADGDTKRVPWSEIDRVVISSTPAPNAPLPPAPPAPPPMVGERARVHIVSPTRVVLYRRPAGSTSWSEACVSPCDQLFPIGDTYRVVGNGVPTSKDFTLGSTPGATVTVAVDPPSSLGVGFGVALTAAGGVAAYVGLLVAASRSSQDDTKKTGLIALAFGAGAVVGGLLLFFSSSKTGVALTSMTPKDAFRRDPVWRTANATTPTPTTQFPVLFSHAF